MVINFICRASKTRKTGLTPIEMSIIIDGERGIITLDRQIQLSKWIPKTQSVRGDKDINEYLNVIRKKCWKIETELLREDNLDIDTFIHSFKYGIKEKEDSLIQIFDKHNELYKSNVLCGKVDNTALYKYRKSRDRVAEYISSLGKKDIKLKDITSSFIEGYENWMLLRLKKNTVNKQLKMLKKILTFAVKERYIDINPFQMVLKDERLEYHPLTTEQLEVLVNLSISNERLSSVRDLFLFQCFTGLAYADMASLVKGDIVGDIIIKNRKKTDVQSFIPILPPAKAILEKYDYKLPIISNQKYNAYLKVLGDMTEWGINLHSHLARHTCATILLNNGIELSLIAKILGHSSTKITEKIYCSITENTVKKNTDRIAKAFEL